MKVNIVENYLSNGMVSITLDSRHEGVRTQRRLPDLFYKKNPTTPEERKIKKERKQIVQMIKARMESDALYSDFMLDYGYDLKKNFFEYADTFIAKSTGSNKRHTRAVTKKLKQWYGKENLPFALITPEMMKDFKRFLDNDRNGITPYNYFKKLKSLLKQALADKHLKKNPLDEIPNLRKECAKKDTLTEEEIMRLVQTPSSNEVVKRAFIFSCLTGLRFCDIKELTWGNIDNDFMSFKQSKTKRQVDLTLDANKLTLMGKKQDNDNKIFKLPSHTACLKCIRLWVKEAEIGKHITFHCGRHSFGTILAQKDVNPVVISKLMGHSKLEQTMTYVRVNEQQKMSALNTIKINCLNF